MVTVLAGLSALAIALIPPLTYYSAARFRLQGTLESGARSYASEVAETARQNPAFWNTLAGNVVRLEFGALHISAPRDPDGGTAGPERRRVYDRNGRLVVESAPAMELAWPVVSARLPVMTGASWLGQVETSRSLREVLFATLGVGFLSLLIGALIFIGLRVVPLRMLHQALDQAAFLSAHDPLTGLPNRRLLMDRLYQALASSARSNRKCALLFVDLDNIKTLNDTLGHETGDLLLQEVAHRLTSCVREADTVARLGGDEFVVILENLSENPEPAATQAETIGKKILAEIDQPYLLLGQKCRCSASIGITLFGNQRESIGDLISQADIAMYQAKEAGRNTLRFFSPALQAAAKDRVSKEADLRHAIAEKQFLLFYQAQIDHGRVVGAEALVRWHHPEHGMVPPGEFIPLAEETGLILSLGEWVLETACMQLAEWATQLDMTALTIAVNVSARQFRQTDFVERVLGVISRTGVNPERLKLELTESLLVENVQDIIEKMFALKAKGIGFSLDDFGTGYSSLSYLKRLPLDQLKIDKSFVRDVLTDPNDATIAKTIVTLAQSLGLGVIAEGVETPEQRDFLASAGCHAYQGYFFSRPLSLEGFKQFVRKTALPVN